MAIKDLFNKEQTAKLVSSTNRQDISEDIESEGYYYSEVDEKNQLEPHVDYSLPRNFAKYGSAKKYYLDSISNIYTSYPFDGSQKEKTQWQLSASGIDKYIFENEYPRTNGFVDLSYGGWGSTSLSTGSYFLPVDKEYITIFGGPNKDPNGATKKLATIFQNSSSNFYDQSENRESNLELGADGNAVEFWMKKEGFVSSGQQEVVFDLWASGSTSGADDYGRFAVLINSSSNAFHLTYLSGTSGINASFTGADAPTTASIADGEWHHYAISVDSSAGSAKLYVDGTYKDSVTGTSVTEVTGALVANIGSYYEARSADTLESFTGSVEPGWCKLSASIDEFRFWKSERTDKNIGRNWFTQVGGGTNSDDANTSLGVYYKFNEGITLTASIDSKVLDYSGRFSDGTWTGYTQGARSTGSAMVEAGAAEREFQDPIIYSFHPDVAALVSEKEREGIEYDYGNAASIYYSIPSWIIEEDDTRGDLLNLTQVISSFFDSLHLKIQDLPKLKDVQYVSSSLKPYPFTKMGIESLGFTAPDLFVEASLLEAVASRNETEDFDEKIYNIKNVIYQNIYNNLLYIYKSKGTIKSFRNLLRCYGIDEELVRVNLYTDGATYELEDDYKLEGLDKKFVNFAGPDRFNGSVYQTSSADISNSTSFLTASTFDHPMTFESEVLFPRKIQKDSPLYFETGFVSSSLFGVHTAKDDGSDYTWETGDPANFQVYAVRNSKDSQRGKLVLKSTSENAPFPTLETEIYKELYDNTNWNFAVRLRQEYELLDTGSVPILSSSNPYVLEFYGVETEGDFVRNEFLLTSSLDYASGSAFIKNNKRFYAGSHRTNFTGSTIEKTDVKITSNRVWYSYLDDDVMRVHGKDSTNFGTKRPYDNVYALYDEVGVEVPAIDTLALHWGYNTLSSSDGGSGPGYTAGFYVDDLSSGSVSSKVSYGPLDDVLKKEHPGRGNFFLASDDDAITKEYLSNAKLQGPEEMQSDDLVQIINGQDDQVFTRDSRPLSFRYAIEKGMNQVISDEMINVFGSIIDFNNLIGEPINRYRQDYQDLGKLRQIFFSRIQNTPNLIKYVDFYKWIDSSITSMLQQLIPATSNFSPDVTTVVESHILERNKYYNKFPTIESKQSDPEDSARGINELFYPWKEGHAPINTRQNTNCFWWRNRAEPGQLPLNPDPASVRSGIIDVAHSSFQRNLNLPYRFSGDGILNTDEDANNIGVVKEVIKFGSNGFISISADDVAFEEEDCVDEQE
jgi:hypothetical protein